MKTLTLGADPGICGSLAFYDFTSKELVSVHDMPLKTKTAKYNEIDLVALGLLIGEKAERIALAVIEEVGARPGEGRTTVFKFGFAAGALAMATASYLIPTHHTPPSVWKSLMGLSSNKDLSRKRAQDLWPSHSNLFTRKKDDGRAEAALLAKFGERLIGRA